jgi:hypothetical protein
MTILNRIAGCLALAAALGAQAAPSLVVTPGALGANDTVNWAQLGVDGTTVTQSFSALSANAWSIAGLLTGSDGCVAVVTTGSVCGWSATSGFVSGDSTIWAENGSTYSGSGPVSLSFSAVFGAGLYVQATSPGSFTASIDAYNGVTLLGSFTVTSPTGSGVFIGVLDTVADITRIQVGLTACSSGCDTADFAVNQLMLKEAAAVPEAPTATLLGLGLLALPWVRRRMSANTKTKLGVQA